MEYEVNGTKLNINGKTHDFKHHINDIIKVKKLIVVHLFDSLDSKDSIDISKQPFNNIYGINEHGDIEWNINDIVKNDEMYTGIKIDNNEKLIVNTFIGVAFVIDVDRKRIIKKYLTK